MGGGPLTEEGLRRHIHPLFSRVLRREEIYLANHSLGRPLDATADDLQLAMDLWYEQMDGAWAGWMDAIQRFRALQAALIGCARADAVVPRVSAGQGLRAALNALPQPRPTVVATRGEFDSIDHILKTYARQGRADIRWLEPDGRGLFSAEAAIAALRPGTDLLVLSMVYFATGQLVEGLPEIVAAARRAGSMVLLDCYHAAGAIPMTGPLAFDALAPDFAIGGNYKYTRGGPGAGWLAIHPRHLTPDPLPPLFTLDTGWFAKRGVFEFRRPDQPELAAGGDAWLEATPAVLTSFQALAGLELTLGLGVDRLRAYSLEQQSRLAHQLAARGVPVLDFEPHGAFLLVPSSDFQALCDRIRSRGVNVDARPSTAGPERSTERSGFVRVCPDILTTDAEISLAAARIAEAFESL
ncbi:MAG: aminotransferase class V-fold PLP-dependent enzyme [Phycisphaerales bacterium]|nr:aminotransferase class V-fold PLP-dependent enzyme [Phycisphaerales bacterium]